MLHATHLLIDALTTSGSDYAVAAAAALTVERFGSRADADALLPVFLEQPVGRSLAIPALARLGDAALARRLFDACCDEHGLREAVDPQLLYCFGYHQLMAARPIVWGYARLDPALRYRARSIPGENRPAVMAMLHMPCDDMRAEIEAAIRLFCNTDVLFPEYLPALAAKTGSRDLLAVIHERGGLGEIDFIGGFALGVALYGAAGRDRFRDLIWAPEWKAVGDTDIFDGMCALGMSVADVFDDFRSRETALASPWRGVDLVATLLRYRIDEWHGPFRFVRYPPDDLLTLRTRLFLGRDGGRGDDTLQAAAARHFGVDSLQSARVEELEQRLMQRYEMELLAAAFAQRR